MFEKFLIEHDLLDRFRSAFCNQAVRNNWYGVDEWIRHRGKYSQAIAVSFAFSWEDTKLGHDFWEDVNNKWFDFLAINNIESNRKIPRDDVQDSLNIKTLKDISNE
jgi:hypothetical protein